ncbi:site-specific integrase [Chitinophaga sp. sic0106]|uniref:tyrosine-type recombinase/integrase n=1 Tax=Chitinophaga sp. sic0106 TaxID=2854785 RepID=UPI001C46249F|nr:site-specific integrase [Chitinophaga sp. sic0106]MBV7529056.1 site-specific integrase [Chitinophaga sp. sic0106]
MSKAGFTKPKIFDHCSDLSEQWFVHFRHTHPGPGPLTGKRKQFRYKKGINYFSTLEDRRREAKALASELHELLKGGWNPWENEIQGQPKTVLELHTEMWELKTPTLEKDSVRTYVYKYQHWMAWLNKSSYGHLPVSEFLTRHAYEYLDHCSKAGHTGSYFNSFRQMPFSLFDMIKERKIISQNPFADTKNQKKNTGSATIFTPPQIRLVRNFTMRKYPELGVFCDYIYYTFMRPLELLRIKIKHIDFERYRINLPPDIAKNDTQRTIVLPPALRKHLRELRKNLQVIYDRYSKTYPKVKLEDYYVFGIYKKGGGPQPSPRPYIKRDSITTMFREKVRKPLRLSEHHTPYVFKHTGVDEALRRGASISGAMKQTGHKSLKNFQIYMRSLNQQDNPEFETIDF